VAGQGNVWLAYIYLGGNSGLASSYSGGNFSPESNNWLLHRDILQV